MKKILFITLIFSFFISSTQDVRLTNIASVKTHEKNKKKIFFEKQVIGSNTSFLLKAENNSSKDFTKCKWVTSFSKKQFLHFINQLDNLEPGSSTENSLFSIIYKKNKIKIYIKDTKCTSEHKMYYFQKSCSRKLKFTILEGDILELITTLRSSVNELNYVTK